jgi:hypothetical protein
VIGAKRDAAGDAGRDGGAGPAGLGDAEIEGRILQAVRSLEYGSVEITVHEARVVRIERREKVRFDRPAASTGQPGRPERRFPGPRPSGSRFQD